MEDWQTYTRPERSFYSPLPISAPFHEYFKVLKAARKEEKKPKQQFKVTPGIWTLPCEQRFLSGKAFSIRKVVRVVACPGPCTDSPIVLIP